MKQSDKRKDLLTSGALSIGARWVEEWREVLQREGRLIEGGWPGTLAEARARVTAHFAQTFAEQDLPHLTAEELGRVARVAYANAKRKWLSLPAARSSAHER